MKFSQIRNLWFIVTKGELTKVVNKYMAFRNKIEKYNCDIIGSLLSVIY